MFRADAGLVFAVVGLCLFAAAADLDTLVMEGLLAAILLGHVAVVALLCRRCTLVAGTISESPRKLLYGMLGFGLFVVFLVWPYSLTDATSAQIQSTPDWQVGITYMTPALFASAGASLLMFHGLCMMLTVLPDIFTQISFKSSAENND